MWLSLLVRCYLKSLRFRKNISDHILFLINPVINILAHLRNDPLVNILFMLERVDLCTVDYSPLWIHYIEEAFLQLEVQF